jgi:hypothetical protein
MVFRNIAIAFAASLMLALAGCSTPVTNYQGSVSNLEALKMQPGRTLSLGQFKLDPTKSNLNSVSARTTSLKLPSGSNYADYLKQGAKTELETAGRLDANSPLKLEGILLQNDLSAAIGTGTSTVSARFSISDAGKPVFDKVITQNSQWESSFIGAIAIPAAIREHGAAFQKLLNKLFTNEDFRKITAK